ncbi:hypothetical protein RRF57_006150 [Xylaria bambusicola]|uniref:Uncharacterized protein n=1 Tax=Xylaria bambusicola TaxID=326684 RepID=A0AAN7UDU5_9PEZI
MQFSTILTIFLVDIAAAVPTTPPNDASTTNTDTYEPDLVTFVMTVPNCPAIKDYCTHCNGFVLLPIPQVPNHKHRPSPLSQHRYTSITTRVSARRDMREPVCSGTTTDSSSRDFNCQTDPRCEWCYHNKQFGTGSGGGD